MPTHLRYILLILTQVVFLTHQSAYANQKPTTANSPPPPKKSVLFKATYKGKISGFRVEMTRSLIQKPDGQYVFSSKALNFFASINETSAFKISQDSVKIDEYRYKRSIARRKTLESIDYDWPSLSAKYTRANQPERTHDFPLIQNTLDPSLYQLFLQADTALNKTPLSYRFIKRKRIENYQFIRLDDETITLNNKKHTAWVLIRKDAVNNRKKTKVWIIPELDYQIGKIEHTDKKGSTYSAYLSKYSSDSEALQAFYALASTSHGKHNTPEPPTTKTK